MNNKVKTIEEAHKVFDLLGVMVMEQSIDLVSIRMDI